MTNTRSHGEEARSAVSNHHGEEAASAAVSNRGPLAGVRVLDLTSVLLGPSATMLLADMGADVIKIEAPEGDTTRHAGPGRHSGMAGTFLAANRNKRSLCLDLKKPSAQRALWRLIDGADVFVHSIRPEAIARLGFGHAAVLARNPRIVYAGAHGFGLGGPYANRPAYDDVIQAASGICSLMERITGEALHTPMVTADKTVGLTVTYGILAALFHRERTGQGQFVEIPMFETMTQFVLVEHQYGHVFDPPEGPIGYPRVLAKWRRPYPTADGWLCVLPYTDRHWQRFVTEAGRPELADDPRYRTLGDRTRHIDEVYGLTQEFVRHRTTDDWVAAFERLEIPHMRVNRLEDLAHDPHLRAVGMFERHEHPTEGAITLPRPAVRFSATPATIRTMAPRLGEHSRAILTEAGLSEAEIGVIVKEGATVDAG